MDTNLEQKISSDADAAHLVSEIYESGLLWVLDGRTESSRARRSLAVMLALSGPRVAHCRSLRQAAKKAKMSPGQLSKLVRDAKSAMAEMQQLDGPESLPEVDPWAAPDFEEIRITY